MSGDPKDREEGQEPSFKVIDRRRFAPDGSERETTEESVAASSSQPTAEATTPPASPSRPAPHAPGGSGPDPALGQPQGEPYEGAQGDELQPSFATLVLSLSTQALMCLGEIPDAPGQEPRQDLPAARNIIDLLGVLEHKTQGNLTEDEAGLIKQILYDLRMRFVQLSSSAR